MIVPAPRKILQKSWALMALYFALVGLAIIGLGSPLFRVLSFEYASLVALFGSLPVMWLAARYVQAHRDKPLLRSLRHLWWVLLPSIIIPVVVSLVLVRSCDLLYGLGYYAHI